MIQPYEAIVTMVKFYTRYVKRRDIKLQLIIKHLFGLCYVPKIPRSLATNILDGTYLINYIDEAWLVFNDLLCSKGITLKIYFAMIFIA